MYEVIDTMFSNASRGIGSMEQCRQYIDEMVRQWHANPNDFLLIDTSTGEVVSS